MSRWKDHLARLVAGTSFLNYGRDIILEWVRDYAGRSGKDPLRILDIGVGPGDDLVNIGKGLSGKTRVEPFGVECRREKIEAARGRGIAVYPIDIEREAIPAADRSFDVVIANQVLEHTKEIFWIFSEASRVLKTGGILIAGVPNLAAWHNRVLLLFGAQPTCIELLGPHLRGITAPAFREFATCDGFFECLAVRGANFYPFPPRASRVLSRVFPSLSVTLFFLLRRTAREGRFVEVLDSRPYETPYYRGS